MTLKSRGNPGSFYCARFNDVYNTVFDNYSTSHRLEWLLTQSSGIPWPLAHRRMGRTAEIPRTGIVEVQLRHRSLVTKSVT